MSNLKRFLAMTLVMVMMIGSLAMAASARFFDDVDALKDADLTAAVDLLSELGVAKGVSADSFDPESPVTRQQFALFVARIHTATPEYFVPSDSEKDVPPFADVVDKTYFTAINYCYENQIINGMKEPTDDDKGEFNPTDSIIFQDAIKMLVSALGYAKSGLSYPVGYLAKAKEIGLLENFGLDKIKAGDTVTRANMAGLLYNYFLSDYIEVQMVWNPVKSEYVANQITTPVCSKFGITKIEGYVTAVEGAALPMWVEDPYATPVSSNTVRDLNWVNIGANDPISMRTATATSNGYDLVLSWVTPETKTTTSTEWITLKNNAGVEVAWQAVNVSTDNRVVGNLRTTKKALGLAEDYADLAGSRELLGLKVIAYIDTNNTGITLPKTVVVGSKYRAESKDADADAWATNHDRRLKSFTFKDADGAEFKFTQYNAVYLQNYVYNEDFRDDESDINWYTGYVFTGNNTGKALNLDPNYTGDRYFDKTNNVWSIVNYIKKGGHIDVDVIDNGLNRDGTPNRYVIFTPYTAVYLDGQGDNNFSGACGDGAVRDNYWTLLQGDGKVLTQVRKSDSVRKVVSNVDYKEKKFAGRWDGDQFGYYVSNQGEYVIREKDMVRVSSNATVTNRNSTTVTLNTNVAGGGSIGTISIDFTGEWRYYKTLFNRKPTNGDYVTVAGTNAYAIGLEDKFMIFTDDPKQVNYGFYQEDAGAFFLVRKSAAAPMDTAKHYAYIVSTNNSVSTFTNGTSYVRYTVYDFDTRTLKEIRDVQNLVSPYNRGAYIVYYYQGLSTDQSTHRITGVVDPLTILSTSNTKDLTGARADLRSVLATFGTITDNSSSFVATTDIGDAFLAQRKNFADALGLAALGIAGIDDIFDNIRRNGAGNLVATVATTGSIDVGITGDIATLINAVAVDTEFLNAFAAAGLPANLDATGGIRADFARAATVELYDVIENALGSDVDENDFINGVAKEFTGKKPADFTPSDTKLAPALTAAIAKTLQSIAKNAADAEKNTIDTRSFMFSTTDKIVITNTGGNKDYLVLPAAYEYPSLANVTPSVADAANDFYWFRINNTNWNGWDDLTGIIDWSTLSFIQFILNTPTNATAAGINAERAIFYSTVQEMDSILTNMKDGLLALETAVARVTATNGDKAVLKFAQAYYAVVEQIFADVKANIVPAVQTVFDRLTNSNSLGVTLSSTGTTNLNVTKFLDVNEAGWLTTDNQFTFNVYNNGFSYNPVTRLATVGRPGSTTDFVSATVQSNTQIMIYGINSQTIFNMITVDQLNAFIYQLNARPNNGGELDDVIRSALLVRDNVTGTSNGTAKLLILGVDEDDDYANDLLNTKNNAGEELVVTTIRSTTTAADNTRYYVVDALDLATRTTTTVAVSALDPLYGPQDNGERIIGQTVYLSEVYVNLSGTQYRVAQLLQSIDNKNILSTSYLTAMINNTNSYAKRAVNYEPGVGITSYDGYSYAANTGNISFINLTLTVNSANQVTGYTINDSDVNLKVGATGTASSFSTKDYKWAGFNSIRKSEWQTSAGLPDLTNYPTSVSGTWYVVPAQYSTTGSVTLIYVK